MIRASEELTTISFQGRRPRLPELSIEVFLVPESDIFEDRMNIRWYLIETEGQVEE